ncbi:MAG: hypothetical protein P8090_13545 [Gammaproteobacteria bacterium]
MTQLPLNRPAVGGWWYGAGSPLSRRLNVSSGYAALYAVQVLPGVQYTLQLSTPRSLQRVHASLYDRWPLLPGARRIALPSGPLVVPPRGHRLTYRWRFGVSARSTADLLYLVVEYPLDPGRRGPSSPYITVSSPPRSPLHSAARGVTYLQGPRDLVLVGQPAAVSYVFDPSAPPAASAPLSRWSVPGDLISNGNFDTGLKNWVPLDLNATGRDAAGVRDGILRLPPAAGVRQELDADVHGAGSLLLWVDLRLDGAAAAIGPGLAIEVCYRDRGRRRHCGRQAQRLDFYDAAAPPDNAAAAGQRVPAGRWYRYQSQLLNLQPPPARIESIALFGGRGAGTARVRQIHLILRGRGHAMQ